MPEQLQHIPLNKLVPWDGNVRRTAGALQPDVLGGGHGTSLSSAPSSVKQLGGTVGDY